MHCLSKLCRSENFSSTRRSCRERMREKRKIVRTRKPNYYSFRRVKFGYSINLKYLKSSNRNFININIFRYCFSLMKKGLFQKDLSPRLRIVEFPGDVEFQNSEIPEGGGGLRLIVKFPQGRGSSGGKPIGLIEGGRGNTLVEIFFFKLVSSFKKFPCCFFNSLISASFSSNFPLADCTSRRSLSSWSVSLSISYKTHIESRCKNMEKQFTHKKVSLFCLT